MYELQKHQRENVASCPTKSEPSVASNGKNHHVSVTAHVRAAIPCISNQCPAPYAENDVIPPVSKSLPDECTGTHLLPTTDHLPFRERQTVPLMLSSRISCSTCSTLLSSWPWAYCSRVSASRYCCTWAMRL